MNCHHSCVIEDNSPKCLCDDGYALYNGTMCEGQLPKMDGWIDGWMDGWIDEWMDVWVDGWMDGWIDELMDGCMDGWMEWVGGWMDGWMDGWKDGWIDYQYLLFSLIEAIYIYIYIRY